MGVLIRLSLLFPLIVTSFLLSLIFVPAFFRDETTRILSQTEEFLGVKGFIHKYVGARVRDNPKYLKVVEIPEPRVQNANCTKIIEGDWTEVFTAQWYKQTHNYTTRTRWQELEYGNQSFHCEAFVKDRLYMMKPVSREEAEFPIAFSILMYKDVEQVEQLLRVIYRPQNTYCIHIDLKAKASVRSAMTSVASCFDNVFIATKSVDVVWGAYSVLEPELVCMRDLWEYMKWKYFINLTGQEFPLRTNLELVRILKVFNGANNVNVVKQRQKNVLRAKYIHKGNTRTKILKQPPPFNMTLRNGAVHIAASRAFVDFVLHDKVGIEFGEWVKDTGHADELFFNSLNSNPQLGVPGAQTADLENHPLIVRYKNWTPNKKCHGKVVRNLCIFGVGDLAYLSTRKEMFVNKFHIESEPLALSCMEEVYFDRIREEVAAGGDVDFNTTFYENLSFVKHHQ